MVDIKSFLSSSSREKLLFALLNGRLAFGLHYKQKIKLHLQNLPVFNNVPNGD